MRLPFSVHERGWPRSCCSNRRRPPGRRTLCLRTPPPSSTTPSFTPSALTVNPRDWSDLKANFQLNTYYPAHFAWRDQRGAPTSRSAPAAPAAAAAPSRGCASTSTCSTRASSSSGSSRSCCATTSRTPASCTSGSAWRCSRAWACRPRARRMRASTSTATTRGSTPSSRRWTRYSSTGTSRRATASSTNTTTTPRMRRTASSTADLDPASYSPKPFRPVTHELDPDPRPLAEMVRAINHTAGGRLRRVLSPYLDLEAFVRHVAVEAFLAEVDGVLGDWGMNNFYLYRFERSTRSTLIPWDKSESFTAGVAASIWRNVDDVPADRQNVLMCARCRCPTCAGSFSTRCCGAPRPRSARRPAGRGGWSTRFTAPTTRSATPPVEDAAKPHSNDAFEADVERLVEFARSGAPSCAPRFARERSARRSRADRCRPDSSTRGTASAVRNDRDLLAVPASSSTTVERQGRPAPPGRLRRARRTSERGGT